MTNEIHTLKASALAALTSDVVGGIGVGNNGVSGSVVVVVFIVVVVVVVVVVVGSAFLTSTSLILVDADALFVDAEARDDASSMASEARNHCSADGTK